MGIVMLSLCPTGNNPRGTPQIAETNYRLAIAAILALPPHVTRLDDSPRWNPHIFVPPLSGL